MSQPNASPVRRDITPAQRMLSACVGSGVTALLVTPLDVVKVRLQSQASRLAAASTVSGPSPSVHYRNSVDALIKITKLEGPRALWTGLRPTLLMVLPSTSFYFAAYEELKDRLTPVVSEVSFLGHTFSLAPFLAGGGARIITATAVSPIELVRTQMQSKDAAASRLVLKRIATDAFSSLRGFASLWRGVVPTLWRDVPFSMLYFAGYEALRSAVFTTRYSQSSSRVWDVMKDSFPSGFLAGSFAAAVTTPSDVVKTRMQIKDFSASNPPQQKPTARAVFRSVVEKEGWKGLYVGVGPRVARTAPACAIMITCYEITKSHFIRSNANRTPLSTSSS